MSISSRFPTLRVSLLAAVVMLALPAAAQVSPKRQAEIDALRERVTELQVQEMLIRTNIREVGGAATTARGITNARVSKDLAEEQIRRLDTAIGAYVKSTEEMEQLQRQAASDIDRHIEEANQGIGNKAKDKVMDYAGTQGLSYVLATETGPLFAIGIKVIDRAGRAVVSEINERQLGEQILAERRNLIKAVEIKLRLTYQSAAEIVRVRELQNLQEQFLENLDALAQARQRLDLLTTNARSAANIERVTDAAGDEEEKRKAQGAGVRLCDPGQKNRRVGIRQSQKKASSAKEKLPGEKTGKTAADDDACLDITGFWTFTTTIQVHDRKVSTAPVRAEIALADRGGATTFEIFPASKAQAPSGPIMRCSLDGQSLTCQRRVQPQACPESKYVWAPLNLNVSADGSAITGDFQQTMTMDMNTDPSGCTLVQFDGLGKLAYRFEPVEASQAMPSPSPRRTR